MREYPEKWLASMKTQLGDEFDPFLASLQEKPVSGLRINPLRFDMAEDIICKYAQRPVPWFPKYGRYVEKGHPASDIAHFSGAYYIQEPSAMSAASVLAPRQGEMVLDLCAAPGGKSGQIAGMLGISGLLISNEIDHKRAKILAGNIERLGIVNCIVVCAAPEKLAEKWPSMFDAILCDAPCSGEGMFRKEPETINEWTSHSADGCSARQKMILTQAVKLLKPGGRLVYSTCTFNRKENEENIAWLTEKYTYMHPCDFELPGVGKSSNGCIRLWPHKITGEGHFVSLLKKEETETDARHKKIRAVRSREAEDMYGKLTDYIGLKADERFESLRPRIRDDRLEMIPISAPDLDGIYTVRCGLPCARIGRSHIEPEHSLAMALTENNIKKIFEADEEHAAAWLKGMSIQKPSSHSGYCWVCHNGMPIGWGKYTEGMIKNKLPSGLISR